MSGDQLHAQIIAFVDSMDSYGSDIERYRSALNTLDDFKKKLDDLHLIDYDHNGIVYELNRGSGIALDKIDELQRVKPKHGLFSSMRKLSMGVRGARGQKGIETVLMYICLLICVVMTVLIYTVKAIPRWVSSMLAVVFGIFAARFYYLKNHW